MLLFFLQQEGCFSYYSGNGYTTKHNHPTPYTGLVGQCYMYLNGWYRFTGSVVNSQLCNTGNHFCSSYFLGLLDGSFPQNFDEVVQRTASFASHHGCYSSPTSVLVQNCGSFYVYYFTRHTLSCEYPVCGSGSTFSMSISPSLQWVCKSQLFNLSVLL